jgi:hypothetical protein
VCVHTWVYSALHIANMWEYIYIIVFVSPLLNYAVPEFRVCVLNTYLCMYIYTCVCVYTHMCTQCVHIVGCALVNACIGLHTHILSQARMHVYACASMCALPTAA